MAADAAHLMTLEERSGNALVVPSANDRGRRSLMGRFVGIHTLPGFTREMLEGATERLGRLADARFVRAYSSFKGGKVVCDWDARDKDAVARTYSALGLPYDEIVAVDAICERGDAGVETHYL
jgi:hypothetical protein